uniref:Family with sequence similarity 187 member A n=1 Tax=Leptobrachium leishanense TaxID=445787 RepID=A0A8C5QGT7_9ANUR
MTPSSFFSFSFTLLNLAPHEFSPVWKVPLHQLETMFFCLAFILFYQSPLDAFEIAEKVGIFEDKICPAFLVFESVAYLTDMTFELPCHCKPEQISSVVWYYQKRLSSRFTQVLTDFKGSTVIDSEAVLSGSDLLQRFSIRMFSLIVFQARAQDSGHYICGTHDHQYFYGYYVDMQQSKGAHLVFKDQNSHTQEDLITNEFVAFTTFWEWTLCDRCSVRGEQRRLGLCYIRSDYLYPRYLFNEDNVASCGSGAVPSRFKTYLAHRKPEILVRSCTAPCYVASNGLMGAKPHLAVAWDKNDERMYLTQYLVGVNKSMRVYIDLGNHLNIRYVQRNDRAIYYCWLQGKRQAGFRLEVTRDPKRLRKLTDQESIFAMKIIGLGILCYAAVFMLVHCLKCFVYNFKCLPF